MKKISFLFLFLACTCIGNIACAWGLQGHRIVGEIAQQHLSRKAKREIVRILGNESLAMASNWADFIKSDPSYKYLNSWHYVNFPAGISRDSLYHLLATDTTANAYNRLNFLVGELKSNRLLQPEHKALYLRLIVHIVGDMHQPMHAGRPEDLGGNRIQLTWFKEPTNLHRVWDEQLIDFQQLSYTEYTAAINFSTKAQRKTWQAAPVQDWLFESAQLADKLYAQVKTGDKLSYPYNFNNIASLNDRLLKGGVRLAGLLNALFG